jgi:hypothetical protein
VYKVWSGTATDDGVTDIKPLVGTVDVTTTTDDGAGGTVDNTETTVGTSTFSAGGSNVVVTLTADAASFGSDPAAPARNVIFVSIESGTGSSDTPSTAQPLWALYTAAAPTGTATSKTTEESFIFGTFAPKAADRYEYFLNGRGKAGVRGTTIVADDSSLARPPIGYYYGAFLVGETDTLYLGELTAPYPRRNVSLHDADVNLVDPVVSTRPPLLTATSLRFDGTTKGLAMPLPYKGFANLVIALQAKLGAAEELPPNMILVGGLPEKVTTPPATTP